MNTLDLFTTALLLDSPWKVSNVEFRETKKEMELHINISFIKGGQFNCPIDNCDKNSSAYDRTERTWRHLNFFQYKTYIHADLPRMNCVEHGVQSVRVPWARAGSGFTLLFEGWVVELSKHLPVSRIASMVDEYDTRLWRFIHYYVEEARKAEDYSKTKAIGIDETSKKGHNYITVVADLVERKVIYVTPGKDSKTVNSFVADFKEHNGNPDNIGIVTCDMSLGFRKGILENFKNAKTIIDKFHVIKHANEAVDKVRREESRTNAELKKTKYIWLKNEVNLTEKQLEKKEQLSKLNLKTAKAYVMKVSLQDIYNTCTTEQEADGALRKLCSWMMHSRLEEMKKFTKTLRNHWDEILNYFNNRYTNAILEGMNSIIQNIKCRARGFRNDGYFQTMIYLVCGKLDLDSVMAKG